MSDDVAQLAYSAPAPPVQVGAVEGAEVTFNVVGGADYGIYSSIQ